MAETVNKAKFAINASGADDRGYSATSAEELVIALEDATDVSLVRYDLFDEDDSTSPLASLNAPDLTFDDASHSISFALGTEEATIDMIANTTESHSWKLRATAIAGSDVHIFERLISLKNGLPRKTVPGESTECSLRGWSDAWNELIDYLIATLGGLSGGLNPPSTTGSTSYIFVLSDATRELGFTAGTAATATIPPNSDVDFPLGARMRFHQYGAGQVTVAPGSGVTIRTPATLKARAQYSALEAVQIDTDLWLLSGDLEL